MKVQLGSDPEFFLKRKSDGEFIPATSCFSSFLGTPYTPFYDGFQGEITVEASDDIADAVNNVRTAVKQILKAVLDHGVEPVAKPSVFVSQDILDLCPSAVFMFGCDPSTNAYTKAIRDSKVIKKLHRKYKHIMMAGGHVHIGMPKGQSINKPSSESIPYAAVFEFNAVDLLRMFESLGVSLLSAIESLSIDRPIHQTRRLFYGLAGEYRDKIYGLEARSPSAAWMMCPELTELMYSAAVLAFYAVYTGEYAEVYDKISLEEHISAINSSDTDNCLKLFNKSFEVIRGALASGHDLQIGSECKYPNLLNVFDLVADKVKKGFDYFQNYSSMQLAWGL